MFLFNPGTGPVNLVLSWLGIKGPLWFNDPSWSKPSLVILGVWVTGDLMIVFLAAMLAATTAGVARVVLREEQFDDVRAGDILVCHMTNPAWVVLFTKIAGLVTNAGGLTAHPAVLSREFGIPAVVGTQDATTRIATGDRIRVDGSSGLVEVLEAATRPASDLFTV